MNARNLLGINAWGSPMRLKRLDTRLNLRAQAFITTVLALS